MKGKLYVGNETNLTMRYAQNIFKKAADETMGIPRKGWSVSKCSLPSKVSVSGLCVRALPQSPQGGVSS